MKKFYTLIFATILFSNSSAQSGSSVCGDWLCGGTMATVRIEASYNSGGSGGSGGVGISVSTGYKTYSCCVYSTPNNACSLNAQTDKETCSKGRINAVMRDVRKR